MLILEIAAGIVLAVVILLFWRQIAVLTLCLVVLVAIVVFLFWLRSGTSSAETFIEWASWFVTGGMLLWAVVGFWQWLTQWTQIPWPTRQARMKRLAVGAYAAFAFVVGSVLTLGVLLAWDNPAPWWGIALEIGAGVGLLYSGNRARRRLLATSPPALPTAFR